VLIKEKIILNVVWYRFEASSLLLREKHKLILCENRILRKIFEPKKENEKKEGENGIRPMSRQPILTISYYDDRDLRWAKHVVRVRRTAVRRKIWWGNLEGRMYLKDICIARTLSVKRIWKK
jgi:hypothetical protein